MRQGKKRETCRSSVLATCGFLLCALLVLFCGIRLVANALDRQMIPRQEKLRQAEERPSEADTIDPADETLSASAVQETGRNSAPDSRGTQGIPSPEALPVSAVSSDRADLALLAYDRMKKLSCAAAIHIAGDGIRIVSIPMNCVTTGDGLLGEAASPQEALGLMEGIYPMRFSKYISIQESGLEWMVNLAGGLELAGELRSAEEAVTWLLEGETGAGPSIPRQQAVIDAFLRKLQRIGWLQFLLIRPSLQPYVESSLSDRELMLLYNLLVRTDMGKASYLTLPVKYRAGVDGTISLPDADKIKERTASPVSESE